MAATAQQSRYFVGRPAIPSTTRLPAILLAVWLTAPGSWAAGQEWIEITPIPSMSLSDGLVRVAAAPWDDGFYFLNELSLEVLSADARGQPGHRYGGWGTGALSLDLPSDLTVAENSVFVLDQGRHQIVRLDARLNPVATTPLPDDRLPAACIRDARQRFWVAFENRAGLFLYDDNGTLVDVVADEASGVAAVLHPTLLAGSPVAIAVWDPVDALIYLFHLSGQVQRRLPLRLERPILAMAWVDELLMVATGEELLQVNPADGQVTALPGVTGVVDLTYRSPTLYGLDQAGILRVFRRIP